MSVSQSSLGALAVNFRLHQILAGDDVFQVLHPAADSRQTLNVQFTHDPSNQLRVDNKTLLDLQGRSDPQTAIGAARARVDISDGIGQQEPADLAVVGFAELDVVVARAVQTHGGAGAPFGVTQVVQPSDNLEPPFGSICSSWSKIALAAFVISSSASSSLIRRRACWSGSAS